MNTNTNYVAQRERIQTYFDKTALDAWKKFASTEPLSGIRATVRAGREEMRNTLLSRLPLDLKGWRILDAGCGAGMMSIELAKRGADVLGIDLSPQLIGFARDNLSDASTNGTLTFAAGDMLAAQHGDFDAVVAMDSLIHYKMPDALAAVESLVERTSQKIVFTIAPRTLLLSTMHAAGQLFPRSDR